MKNAQRAQSSFLRQKWLVLVPILIALLLVVILVKTRSGPATSETPEAARVMQVISVPQTEVVPRVIGYGIVEPARVWQAVAEVRGRVTEIHPQLKSGAMLRRGDRLLAIDTAEYELAIASHQATITEIKANLREVAHRSENIRHSLEIEKRSLQLASTTLQRKQSALAQKSISATEVDLEERTVLNQRQRVQDLENSLELLPAQRQALEARLAANEAGLQQARLDLAKTVIRAPFDCRIGAVRIQPGQFLAVGQLLFEAHGTAVAEIEAQVQPERLRHLVGLRQEAEAPHSDYREVMRRLAGIKATVRLQSGDWQSSWPARVDRLREEVDPATRAFNVIVAVDGPYDQVIAGRRPPLSRGIFCQVELQGRPWPGSIVIPRSAVHAGRVFIVDDQQRLRAVAVKTIYEQGNLAVVAAGLHGGETLVVSDPTPAITGMLVEPVFAEAVADRLIAEAAGGTVQP